MNCYLFQYAKINKLIDYNINRILFNFFLTFTMYYKKG